MKKAIKFLSSAILLIAIISSCKKEENQTTFQGGSLIAVTASLAPNSIIPISKINKDNAAITFSWTNPNYQLNTGISSQDVNYALQMDTVGGVGFISTFTTKKDLSKTFAQGDFNTYLTNSKAAGGLNLKPDSTYSVKVRIKSYLGTAETADNSSNVYSNVLTFKVKPYSVDPDLWITGDACISSWTNSPPAPQKFAYSRATQKFTIMQTFIPGKQYKFLTTSGAWQPQWGGCGPTGGTISVNPGGGSDPDAINTPAVAGTYTITVDLITKTCTVL
jgi:starch-binding outer membrane protein SusE/F